MKENWELLSSETKFSNRILNIRHDWYLFNRSGTKKDYTVIDTGDWVNIIPLTRENEFILIKQYRHGTKDIVIEIPGGTIEKYDITPEEAARRELLEETGYTSDKFTSLGTIIPNPAIQNNRCYIFLAEDVLKSSEQNLDPHEEIELLFTPRKKISSMIKKGEINHSLVIDAFCLLMLHEGKEI
ncbi:MAG TPA: NUDIX hydrolase [Candidatus Eremiobacteraeota bacterium]|nr:MAG: ADP-ribose pyrophosphatase [bacterium ADurb.Bin363]HPZ08584.1 NUDIX hydrolase [Candidatus Eremiobacteraeota bacterium]